MADEADECSMAAVASTISNTTAAMVQPQFYAMCIGMDDWTKNPQRMKHLLVHDMQYRPEDVCALKDGEGPTADTVIAILAYGQPFVTPNDVFVLYYSVHRDVLRLCTKGASFPCSTCFGLKQTKETALRVCHIYERLTSGTCNSCSWPNRGPTLLEATTTTAKRSTNTERSHCKQLAA